MFLAKEVYDFSGRDKLAKIGEAVVAKFLKTLKNTEEIENVRNNKEYQRKDIDIILTLKNGSKVKIEVKTDSYVSGNMFYETISNDVKNEIGCFEKTEADYIFYYFINPSYRKIYIFNTETLREWKEKHKEEYELKRVFNFKYNSWGYTFPLKVLEEDLKETLTVVKLDNLEDIEYFEKEAESYWNKSKK